VKVNKTREKAVLPMMLGKVISFILFVTSVMPGCSGSS